MTPCCMTLKQTIHFIALLFIVSACAPADDFQTSKPSKHGIQTGQTNIEDDGKMYQVERNKDDVSIGQIDYEDVSFDIPEELAKKQDQEWEDHLAKQSSQQHVAQVQEKDDLLPDWKVMDIFPLLNHDKQEKSSKKRSSMAIAFHNALKKGHMMPAGTMKEKNTAAAAWNQNLTLAIVFGGIAVVSIWTAWILFALLPFPGNLISFLIFLGSFIAFGILGIINLVKGLN